MCDRLEILDLADTPQLGHLCRKIIFGIQGVGLEKREVVVLAEGVGDAEGVGVCGGCEVLEVVLGFLELAFDEELEEVGGVEVDGGLLFEGVEGCVVVVVVEVLPD